MSDEDPLDERESMASAAQARTWVDTRLAALRGQCFSELSQLPESTHELVTIGKDTIDTTTYRDLQPDGSLRIMVQVFYRSWLFGLCNWAILDGFLVSELGDVTEVPEELTWDF